jgi:hypothetical protein
MAGCAACAGCCANCGTTCGFVGGASLTALGSPYIGGSGFDYFLGGNHSIQDKDDNATPVDGDALVDPNHPGHREAVKTLSHVDDDKHEKISQWLKDKLTHIELGSEPDPQE